MALSPQTSAKIAHGIANLRRQQATGEAPPPGQVTAAQLAAATGVSEPTIRAIEYIALGKLTHGLRAKGVSPRDLRSLFKIAPPHPMTKTILITVAVTRVYQRIIEINATQAETYIANPNDHGPDLDEWCPQDESTLDNETTDYVVEPA